MVQNALENAFSSNYSRLAGVFAGWLGRYLAALRCAERLREGVAYALSGDGKRFRPVLALAGAELLGVPLGHLRGSSLAFELLHNATLIHDDLPALDNDDTRRGRPTVHCLFGDGVALLVGDYLFTEAFGVVAGDESVSLESRARLCALLARAGSAVNEGQVLDLEAEGELELRHEKKTASLIAASLAAPAVVAGDSSAEGVLFQVGMKVGLLFQVTDDVLDVTGDEAVMGKPNRSDERQGRVSYTSRYGVEGSQAIAADLNQEIHELLSPMGEGAWFLQALSTSLLSRKR